MVRKVFKETDFKIVMENDIKTHEEKINLSCSKKIKLHLILNNGNWRNGFVKEIKSDFFIFEDVINGKEPIFFLELKKVEPYLEEEK